MVRKLDDWIAETPESIAARLDGAREAQKQTRFTLVMMAIISMVMLILSYNAYLSFDSDWILDRTKEGIAPARQRLHCRRHSHTPGTSGLGCVAQRDDRTPGYSRIRR